MSDTPGSPDSPGSSDHADRLLDLLRCPVTKATLVRDGQRLVSTDAEKRLAYPIRDGFPVMLPGEAEQIDEQTWRAIVGEAAAS